MQLTTVATDFELTSKTLSTLTKTTMTQIQTCISAFVNVLVHRFADCQIKESLICEETCDTRGYQCSIQPIKSAFHCFCADVVVSTVSGSIRSPPFCFNGVNQVKLHPPSITHVGPSAERPECFHVDWKMPYDLTDNEKSHRRIQVEYTTHNQTRALRFIPGIQVQSEAESSGQPGVHSLELVDIQILHDRGESVALSLHFCRCTLFKTKALTVKDASQRCRRRTIFASTKNHQSKPLLWPEANGVVLSYTAWCRSDVDSSQWTCGTLDAPKTSCDLTVSDDACTCSLTATNSAGKSPVSSINIPGHTDAELPPPESISVISLDDTGLRLEWTTAPNQSESGFVVQWISLLDNGTTRLHWQHLNETSRRFIITGLLPEIPYNVSVMRVYGSKAGIDMSVIAFTREGAPSFGPKLQVLQTGGRSIHLRWDPVPIEKLHGFIKFYSILYSINGKDKREQVNSAVDQISLRGLMEGTYNICVMAHTVAGGAAGPWQMVAVGYDDIQVIPILLCTLLLIFIFLIIPVCMWVRIKQCLCPIVPDPSNSSLSVWSKPSQHKRTPSSTMSSFFSTGQTSCNRCYDEKDNSPVQVLSFYPVLQILDDTDSKVNTYNCTSAKTHVNPKLRTDEPIHFQADLANKSFTKTKQSMSGGHQDDYLSLTDPFIDTLPSYQSDPTVQEDLCNYIHLSQSYMSVAMVDACRTLNADECSHVLHGLPEDHDI
ncbi:hypothetical protein E1301_Tti013154 [Triplophysa tibetana]|uniref:Fibronectin type-III domain-containing protein n=1 Tax=Triplophysa tibetana TaxID=1572043 RepID=A0A5A9P7V1_9TELE|nr:hypothetical protein E1301_Tti013154 [Triplophysa tibetana]